MTSPNDPVYPEPNPNEACEKCQGTGEIILFKIPRDCIACNGTGFKQTETEFDADAEWDEFTHQPTRRKS